MSVIETESVRHHVEQFGNQLTFTIPSRKIWRYILVIPIWLIFWSSTIVSAFSELAGGGLFSLIWAIGWGLGCLSMVVMLLSMLLGKEIVEISYDYLHIRRQLFGIGRTKSFDYAAISNLQVTNRLLSHNLWCNRRTIIGTVYKMDGPISFDYGAKTYRFGDGVEEAEAKMIVTRIQQQFPTLS